MILKVFISFYFLTYHQYHYKVAFTYPLLAFMLFYYKFLSMEDIVHLNINILNFFLSFLTRKQKLKKTSVNKYFNLKYSFIKLYFDCLI